MTDPDALAKALHFVSSMISAKVLVMTATNMFKSQKFKTSKQTMKKAQLQKYSASIKLYIMLAHVLATATIETEQDCQ